MDDREKRALGALAFMVKLCLEERPDALVDTDSMGAGERGIRALAEFGYMEKVMIGRTFGRWTDAGHALCQWASKVSRNESTIFPEPSIVP